MIDMENNLSNKVINYIAQAFLLLSIMLLLFRAITVSLNTVWHFPYYHVIYYFVPFVVMSGLFMLASFKSLLAAILSLAAAVLLIIFNILDFGSVFFDSSLTLFISSAFLLLFSLTEVISFFSKRRPLHADPIIYLKTTLSLGLSIILLLSIGTPLLIRNISRIPLRDYSETTIAVSGKNAMIAPSGPAWYFSKDRPLYFKDHAYTSLSWNEIALFGKEPIGFENKRYGEDYVGSLQSVYYASAQDFEEYNMFRYINYEGNELTEEKSDFWKLPNIEELVSMQVFRSVSVQGVFSHIDQTASYEINPDKDAPLWAKNEMVNSYWTSTEYDIQKAFEVHYSGEVTKIDKTEKYDYRGFRAMRTEKRGADLIKVAVEGIRIEQDTQAPVIILKEMQGNRFIAIWIGHAEAYSIALELLETDPPRPLSHDLMLSILGELDAKVESIEITEMKDNIYYSIINLINKDHEIKKIDSRPSDAIALSLRAGSDIYVSRRLMEQMGIEMDHVQEKYHEFDEL